MTSNLGSTSHPSPENQTAWQDEGEDDLGEQGFFLYCQDASGRSTHEYVSQIAHGRDLHVSCSLSESTSFDVLVDPRRDEQDSWLRSLSLSGVGKDLDRSYRSCLHRSPIDGFQIFRLPQMAYVPANRGCSCDAWFCSVSSVLPVRLCEHSHKETWHEFCSEN
jgi:hypothetical protein